MGMDRKHFLRAVSETVIMVLLQKEEMHGYQMYCRLKRPDIHLLKMEAGTLYPILARVEKRGWIAGRWVKPKRGGRRERHVYGITPKGAAEFRRMLGLWGQIKFSLDKLIQECVSGKSY